jgi:hypothetical protein
MPEPTPLQWYLPVQNNLDRNVAVILDDAAAHAERTIATLGAKAGIGAEVRRAQLSAMRAELNRQSTEMWAGITGTTATAFGGAAKAAADASRATDEALFAKMGIQVPEYMNATMLQAVDNVPTLLARGANNISLADSVYGSKNLADGYVDQTINRGILLGQSAKEIAVAVSSLILPSVRGGVSYAANRVARTELNNAFHRTQVSAHKDKPWVSGFRWHLSGSHPKPDECNAYDSHFQNGDAGVFRADEVPGKPHPNCLCYLTTVTVEEDEFVSKFLAGDYDEHMEKTVYSGKLPNRVC